MHKNAQKIDKNDKNWQKSTKIDKKKLADFQFFFTFQVKDCQNANECSKGYQCCGGTCCEEKYYQEFAKLPCISDLGCRVRSQNPNYLMSL